MMNKDCIYCQYGDAAALDPAPCGKCVRNDLASYFVPIGCLGITDEKEV